MDILYANVIFWGAMGFIMFLSLRLAQAKFDLAQAEEERDLLFLRVKSYQIENEILRKGLGSGRKHSAPTGWRGVMGFKTGEKVSRDDVVRRFKELAKNRHPDHGGSTDAMAELNAARATALKEVS